MIGTILVAIVSATSALLGVWITQRYESRRRESEERRWYADYFLGRKIDTLNNLYAALVECHFTLNFYGNCPPTTLKEFKEQVQPKEEAYLRSLVIASIYLDENKRDILSNAFGSFRQASMAIWLSLPDKECPAKKQSYSDKARNLDWEKFSKTYENAYACLKNMLNPEVLKHINKSTLKNADAN